MGAIVAVGGVFGIGLAGDDAGVALLVVCPSHAASQNASNSTNVALLNL
jgi:hypothetical protein